MKTFKDLLTEYNISQSQFSREFEIPLRTVQNWVSGERKPPDYLLNLIEFKLKNKE